MKDNKSSDFHKNFCEALVSANILISALNNAKLKSFLELHFDVLSQKNQLYGRNIFHNVTTIPSARYRDKYMERRSSYQ